MHPKDVGTKLSDSNLHHYESKTEQSMSCIKKKNLMMYRGTKEQESLKGTQ